MIFSYDNDITETINNDLTTLDQWSKTWLIDLNANKTKCMYVTRATRMTTDMTLTMDGTDIEVVTAHKHLGIYLNSRATWDDHVGYIIAKVSKRIGILKGLKWKLDRDSLRLIYTTWALRDKAMVS